MSDLSKMDSCESTNEDAESKAFAELENKLKHCEQKRKEQEFFFIFALVIVIDAALFMHMVDGLACLTIGLLELICLLILADKYDIKYVEMIFQRMTGMFKKD